MPPFRQLSDEDLAGILSYIREKFGGGASPVSAGASRRSARDAAADAQPPA